jgi:integration host factor subunit alpha
MENESDDKGGYCQANSSATGISGNEAAKLLDGTLEILASILRTGEPITIVGFGKFSVRSKLPRKGRNLSTSETIMISARKVVSFRPSALLTSDMNSVQKEQP